MLALEQVSVINDLKGTKGFRNKEKAIKKSNQGASLAAHWLRLHASTAGGVGSIPAQGTTIP